MNSRHSTAGFTLLEVIVVLVITSLISVVLIQGLGLVLGVRTRVAGHILDIDKVVTRRHLVLEPLLGIVPDYPERPNVFAGDSHRIKGLTVRPLQERTGTPTGFTMTLDYQGLRGETVVVYQEEGRDPIELMSWKGDSGAFSYRDHTGDWLDTWPPSDQTSQTPWLVRLDTGTDEVSTLVASVAGAHRRIMRMQDGVQMVPVANQ